MCGSVSILEDSLVEGTETFTVMASGGLFENDQDSVTILIQDNDGMKTSILVLSDLFRMTSLIAEAMFEFTQSSYIALESIGDVEVSLRLTANSGVLTSDVALIVHTQNSGTATGNIEKLGQYSFEVTV